MPRLSPRDRAAASADLERLAERWFHFWPDGDAQAAAADALTRLDQSAVAWDLHDIAPMAGGVVGLVCAATRQGHDVVVKINPRISGGEGLRNEGEAMRFWQQTGAAAEVIDRRDNSLTMLLERLHPGDLLEDADLSVTQTLTELGQIAAALHSAGHPPPGFYPLRGADARRRNALGDFPTAQAELDHLHDVGEASDDEVLLHNDLHARNVLHHHDGWKVIDPHAIRGDRHAEIRPLLEASLRLPPNRSGDRGLVEGWVRTYAAAARLDLARATSWTRVVSRAEACDYGLRAELDPTEVAWVEGLHRIADALE